MSVRAWLTWLASLVLSSCTTLIPPPEVSIEGIDVDAAWARVLAQSVDEHGRIDFEHLRAQPRDLDLVVASIAQRDPASSASDNDRLASYINAYNALAMFNVLQGGALPRDKLRFFYFRELCIGGVYISLYGLENDRIRELGEPRVHFALNCMVRSCPRLPREPFAARELDQQLDLAAREFFNDPRHVQVDDRARVVRLSAILDWYAEDFGEPLVAYANRYREQPLPADYRVEFLSYDWTLNSQP